MSKVPNPNQLRSCMLLSWYALKASLRNKATVFFSLVFPLVLIGAFGLIGNSNPTVKIGIPENVDQKNIVISKIRQIPLVKTQIDSEGNLEDQLKKGKLDAIVDVEPNQQAGFDVTLLTSNANPATSGAAQSVIRGVVDQTNLQLAKVTNPAISLSNKEISGMKSRYIDFILPGQIGFALLSTALFGTVFGLIALRKLMVLKRMFVTPVRPLTILFSQGLSRLAMALVQTTLILIVGILVFHFYLPNGFITFLELLFISMLGLVAFLGFGLFISGLANDENSASPLVNLVSLPQMLLSGVFFGTDLLPGWLQPIANNLPLAYFNQAVRKITTEGGNFTETFPYILGFLAWGLVMYLLATRTFKWE